MFGIKYLFIISLLIFITGEKVMALFGKTYTDKEMDEAGEENFKKICETGKDLSLKERLTTPACSGLLGRGGTLRNKILGFRKKKSKKTRANRKTKKCKCK